MKNLDSLNQEILSCRKCSRLVSFREDIPKRASYKDEPYLRKATPGYGDPNAELLILGLAPSAHGGNRTGRIFTGDESARFLMKMLHSVGFVNQPTSLSLDDGLKLRNCYITAAVKCVPPQNKPLKLECDNCFHYLQKEFHLLPNLKAVLALGQLAYKEFFHLMEIQGSPVKKTPFKHGSVTHLEKITLFSSYHPSPQNTYTGKLTEKMFLSLLNKIKKHLL